MSDDAEAQLNAALRRETALTRALSAFARGGDLESVLTEIADWAAMLTGSSFGSVFVGEGDLITMYARDPTWSRACGYAPTATTPHSPRCCENESR